MSLEISTAGQDRILAAQVKTVSSSGVPPNKSIQSNQRTSRRFVAVDTRHYLPGNF